MQKRDDIYRKESSRLPSRRPLRPPESGPAGAVSPQGSPLDELYAPGAARPNRFEAKARTDASRRTRSRRKVGRRQREAEGAEQKKRIWLIALLAFLLVYIVTLTGTLWRSFQAGDDDQSVSAPPSAVLPVSESDEPEQPVSTVQAYAVADTQALVAGWGQALKHWQQVRAEIDRLPRRTAIERLEEAYALAPHYQDLQWTLARLYYEQKQFGSAARTLEALLGADPARQDAREMWARSLLALQQHAAALAVAEWMLEQDGFLDAGNEIAALALLGMKQPTQAIPYLQRQIILNRTNVEALTHLATAYLEQGTAEEAIMVFEEVIAMDSTHAMAYYQLAASQAGLGQVEMSIATLRQAIDRFGLAFVSAWLGSDAFDQMREQEAFIRIMQPASLEKNEREADLN